MTNCKHEVRRPTDYNDGQIHGWNGGDCPVHPETVVEYWLRTGTGGGRREAGGLLWCHSKTAGDIIAFCVVKEYVEPKVIWVNEYAEGRAWIAHETESDAKDGAGSFVTRIAVKYVECKE